MLALPRRRIDKGVVGLRQVLSGLRKLLQSMPLPHQNTVYSAIHASDGDFAHLVRSLAAGSLQSAFRGHQARASVRSFRVCQTLIRNAAEVLKSLQDAVRQHFLQILTGQSDGQAAARDSGTVSLMTAEEEMLEHIVQNGARLFQSIPRHALRQLILDSASPGSFCQTLVLNRCGRQAVWCGVPWCACGGACAGWCPRGGVSRGVRLCSLLAQSFADPACL